MKVTKPRDGRWGSRRNALTLAGLLPLLQLRHAEGEERLDFKTLYYKEDGDRMRVIAPSVSIEHDFTPTLSIKIEGVYNSISGATPTGAPPPASAPAQALRALPALSSSSLPAPARLRSLWAKAGASPAPAPAPAPAPTPAPAPAPGVPSAPASSSGSSAAAGGTSAGGASAASGGVAGGTAAAPQSAPAAGKASNPNRAPTAQMEDQRYGLVVDVVKNLAPHTVSAQFAYSTESDYESLGLALRDAIDLNQKNTTLMLGAAFNHDVVWGFYQPEHVTKNTADGMVGLTQLLDPKTFITVNLTLGRSQGYLSDPYKVVELNGELVPEKRPEERTKEVAFVSLTHFLDSLDASAELSYRYYHDSYNIGAHTVEAALYKKLGRDWILRPMVRYYRQSAADFYAVRFSGEPDIYSADYRLSALDSLGYGLKLIWKPTKSLSFDVDVERYSQRGLDGVTSSDLYPSAMLVMVGATVWF